MFNMKTAFAAAALAVVTTAGTFSASADPIGRHEARVEHRMERREARFDHRMERRYVDRARVHSILWARHYRMIGNPYFLHGRYVVRTHDRFGHVVLVRIDPWTGAFMGVVRL